MTATSHPSPRALRIALLGYRSHPYGGGQGIYLKYLSKALVNMGHQVDVISGPPYPHLDPRVTLIKVPSLNLFESPRHHAFGLRAKHLLSWADFMEWWSMLTGGFAEPYSFGRRVNKLLKNKHKHYDIIHDNQSLCYGLLDLQKRGFPVVATFHHPITHDLRIALKSEPRWYMRALILRWHSFLKMQKNVVKKLDHIVTVSAHSRRDIARDFSIHESEIDLIHCGIDTAEFHPIPHIQKIPFRLMCTASADQPLKGLKFLLKAVAALRERYPQLSLLVVGKPKAGGYTENLIARLGIGDIVQFVSGISTEQLVQHYNEAEIVVCPSLYEGFGLPAGEAMSCGTAVISSNGGALPEVVGDAGLVVQAGSEQAIADAIVDLFEHPEKRAQLAQAGRARIESTFCWNLAAQQFTQYYQRMLQQRKSKA
ncbi:MAG TPA: glycosyltransferase family 4 protein [Pseudomonadales bacterium]|nr:glycosyltransferase family 4 protein [Pseudomonadales bacterium]HRG49492.1 glycosyltransferase family 4 protein [Pseudomonadales bacterium]